MNQERQTALEIGLVTFGILALDLALIRWASTQIRVFAYVISRQGALMQMWRMCHGWNCRMCETG